MSESVRIAAMIFGAICAYVVSTSQHAVFAHLHCDVAARAHQHVDVALHG